MKKAACILAFFFLWLSPNKAQFGINYTYASLSVSDWNEAAVRIGEEPVFSTIRGMGITYWLRLRSYRWEFLPELSLQFSDRRKAYTVSLSRFGLNNRIYLFDFLNDCNCPTFSKQNTFFKKGFFLEISPAINSFDFHFKDASGIPHDFKNKAIFSFSGGMGLDIGLGNRFTLTPLFRYRQYLGPNWAALKNYPSFNKIPPSSPPPPSKDHWGMLEFGLQLQINKPM